MRLKVLAETILDMIEPMKVGETSTDIRTVMQAATISVGKYRDQELKRDITAGTQPDRAWFTSKVVDVKWDDVAKVAYIDLPEVASMDNDKSIRILPVAGNTNPFVRIPSGFGFARPEILFAEGNIAWIAQRGRVEFPTLHEGEYDKVGLDAILTSVDDDSQIPDKYASLVMNEVASMFGKRLEDTNTDGRAN